MYLYLDMQLRDRLHWSTKYDLCSWNEIQYRSELSGHLFFDNCLNYPNLNYISEQICSLD